MLSRITAYIAKQIGGVAFVATISLCLLVSLVQSVKFIDMIVSNGLPIQEFFRMSVLAMPRYLSYLLPIVLFGATLFTYNRMTNDSEIVVLRAAGISRGRLSRGGVVIGLLGMLICYSLTLYFMPATQTELRSIITQARSQVGSAVLREGEFTNINPESTIYIREKQGENTLLGIIYHNKTDNLTIIADRGNIVETVDGPRIVIFDGNKQIYENGELHLLDFQKSTLDIGLTSEQKLNRWREANERYLMDLLYPNPNDANDRNNFYKLIAQGHARILLPLFCLGLPLIAIVCLLSGPHSRRGQFKQVSMAIGLMLLNLIFHVWLSNAAGKNPQLLYVMYANAILPLLISIFLVTRHGKMTNAGNVTAQSAGG